MFITKNTLVFVLIVFFHPCSSLLQGTKEFLEEIKSVLATEDNKFREALEKYSKERKDALLKKDSELQDLDVNENIKFGRDVNKDIQELEDELSGLTPMKREELFSNALKEELRRLEDKKTATENKRSYEEETKKETTCVDESSLNYCYRRAFAGDCVKDSKEMALKCKRTCRLCCADDQTVITTKRCKLYVKMKLCVKMDYQDRLRVLCPKSCGFCGRAPSDIPCVSSEYGCCWDGSTAKYHIGTAKDGCLECKDKLSKQFCNMFKTDCDNSWGKSGQQVRQFCPETCQICGPNKRCEDEPSLADSCFARKYEGSCETNVNGMKYSCAKTCGLCEHKTISCADTKYGCCADGKTIAQSWLKKGCKECIDFDEEKCKYLKNHHACIQNKDRMKELCPNVCGFCRYQK